MKTKKKKKQLKSLKNNSAFIKAGEWVKKKSLEDFKNMTFEEFLKTGNVPDEK